MGTQRVSETVDQGRRRLLTTAAMGIAAFAVAGSLFPAVVEQLTSAAAGSPNEGGLPSLARANGWLNSEPLSAADLRGKVVLVDFWTYTCINWLRTVPYVRAWAEKYRDQGLVVIGVHTPEFPFEHDVDNVRRAVQVMNLPYPIAIDSDYAIWRGFNNHYWPALYFVDAQGRVRHQQFGEGEYEQAERFIQQLLAEAGAAGLGHDLVAVEGRGVEAPADWANLKSEENYVGYERTEGFASPGGATPDQPHVYAAPARLPLNRWALAGDWTVEKGATVLNKPDGRIVYQFYARDVASRDGTDGEGDTGAFPGAHRRQGAGRRPRIGCRRAGHGDGRRTAALPVGSTADARSPNGSSRSSSSIPAWRRTRSRSAERVIHPARADWIKPGRFDMPTQARRQLTRIFTVSTLAALAIAAVAVELRPSRERSRLVRKLGLRQRTAAIARPGQRTFLAGGTGRLPVDLAKEPLPRDRSRSLHPAPAHEIPSGLEKGAPGHTEVGLATPLNKFEGVATRRAPWIR